MRDELQWQMCKFGNRKWKVTCSHVPTGEVYSRVFAAKKNALHAVANYTILQVEAFFQREK